MSVGGIVISTSMTTAWFARGVGVVRSETGTVALDGPVAETTTNFRELVAYQLPWTWHQHQCRD